MPCYIDHMRKSLRLFFLCLLVVFLPMRSMAGVATAECDMDHPAAVNADGGHGATLLHETAEDAVHEAEHGQAHEGRHDDMLVHSEAPPQAAHACDDCEKTSSAHETAGCGTCAECCIGACAPPPAVAVTAMEETVGSLREFSLSSFTGHIPARIERPPRAA